MGKAQDLLDEIQQEEITTLKARVARIEKFVWYLAASSTIQLGQYAIPIIKAWMGLN